MPSRDDVKAHLAARALALAQAVAPDGKVQGREWVGHDLAGNKIGVVISGPKTCCWQNFHSGQAGRSGLTLIRDVICHGDFVAAWRWALDFIGGGAIAERPAPPPKKPEPAKQDRSVGAFLNAEPFAWDNPVGLYLRGRGIDPELVGVPHFGALRFRAQCWNVEARCHLAAMVAAVIDPATGQHIGVHRTYLERVAGRWRKAAVATPKKFLGSTLGGVIPLTRGASGRPLGRAPAGDCALLGEGIENTLSVVMERPERRALAYLSAGNLPALQLPAALTDLVLIRDRDGLAPAIEKARERAIQRFALEEGRTVSVWEPPRPYKDANAWIMGIRHAA